MSLLSQTAEPVTVTVARRVAVGREREFEQWYDGIIGGRLAAIPGFLGSGVLRPHTTGQDWHVVYRFADPESLDRWESSPERADWLRRAEDMVEETGVARVSGLETWFSLPGRTAPAPPRWKMVLVTLGAIVPLVLLMNLTVLPLLVGLAAGRPDAGVLRHPDRADDLGRDAADDPAVPPLPLRSLTRRSDGRVGQQLPYLLRAAARDGDLGGPLQRLVA